MVEKKQKVEVEDTIMDMFSARCQVKESFPDEPRRITDRNNGRNKQ